MLARSACLLLTLGACSREGAPCQNALDCGSGMDCVGPDDQGPCGVAPHMECALNTDCSNGATCHSISDSCSTGGIGTECLPPCGTCESGFQCNSSGACEAIPCNAGFTCAATQRCDPNAVTLRSHGCVTLGCTHDSDCGAKLSCVHLVCESGPGACKTPMLVP
jgi:hypothetical protein